MNKIKLFLVSAALILLFPASCIYGFWMDQLQVSCRIPVAYPVTLWLIPERTESDEFILEKERDDKDIAKQIRESQDRGDEEMEIGE